MPTGNGSGIPEPNLGQADSDCEGGDGLGCAGRTDRPDSQFRLAAENTTWRAPRIHGELLKLGFPIFQPTVSRWPRRAPRSPHVGQRWLAFLRNHRQAIAAMDFFTVPTLTFGVLYCFFIIGHNRRRILRFNVTLKSPCSQDRPTVAGGVAVHAGTPVPAV